MADIAAPSVSPNLLAAPAQQTAAELAKRADIKKTAQAFEASFLSVMLGQMFDGIQPEEPFSGGHGEEMFRSFMTDAFSQQMAKNGGLGISDMITKELLKLQGMS